MGTACGAFCTASNQQCVDKNKVLIEGGFNVGVSGLAVWAAPTPNTITAFLQKNIGLAIELLMDGISLMKFP